MSKRELDGVKSPRTAKTPAFVWLLKWPPRTSAPGPSVKLAPTRHM